MLTRMHKWRRMRAGVLAAAVAGTAAAAGYAATEVRDGEGWSRHHRMGGFCRGEADGRIEDVAAWIGIRLQLNAGQQAALDDLRQEAAMVASDMRALCDRPEDADPMVMLDYGERALELSLAGVQRVRPRLQAFLDTLDPDQREQVDRWMSHRRHRHG